MTTDPERLSILDRLDTRFARIAGVITSLGILLSALVGYVTERDEIVETIHKLSWLEMGLFSALLLGLVLLAAVPFLTALMRRSRVLRPGRFRLDASDPAHLVGREDDVAVVERACLDAPLVWLTGESGVGKSALARAGLVPKLGESGSLLPVYLDSWGRDWESSPRRALADALWATLRSGERKKLGLEGPPGQEKLVEALGRVHERLGQMPLLVFDQFDDYQARHRARFLPNSRTWLRSEKLEEVNGFWREIAGLLRRDAAHAVFITRNDAAIGLESVRFEEPERLSLFRLPPVFVTTILERVAAVDEGGAVVRHPERGWERLKQRLRDDLGRDGAVLPQQIKTVLLGLRHLPWLTVAAYQRAGELAGVEALHVESEVSRVGGAGGPALDPVHARVLLLTLVDDADASRTVPQSVDDLTERLRASDGSQAYTPPVSAEQVESTLKAFEAAELVRARTDPDRPEQVWQLDHDYLCRAVLQAERKANRWTVLLRERHEDFRRAGRSLSQRWRALLGVWPTVRLALLRLRGRLRYGEHRSYALWSLLRFVPILLVLIGAGIGWRELEASRQALRAADLFDQIEFESDSFSKAELNALWTIAASRSDILRSSFMKQAFDARRNATIFKRRPKVIVHAAVGLDEGRRADLRKYVAAVVFDVKRFEDLPFGIQVALLNLGIVLGMPDREFYDVVVDIVAAYAERHEIEQLIRRWQQSASTPVEPEAIAETEHPNRDKFMAALAALEIGPGPAKVPEGLRKYGELVDMLVEPWARGELAQAEPTAAEAERVSAATMDMLRELPRAIAGDPMPEDEAREIARAVMAALEGDYEPLTRGTGRPFDPNDRVVSLPLMLSGLAGYLRPNEAERAVNLVLAEFDVEHNVLELWTLVEALRPLVRQLERQYLGAKQTDRVLGRLLAALEDEREPIAVPPLAEAVLVLSREFTVDQANRAASAILSRLRGEVGPIGARTLAAALRATAAHLGSDGRMQTVAAVLTELEREPGPSRVAALVEVLPGLATRLDKAQAAQAMMAVLAELERAPEPDGVRALAQALPGLVGWLESDQARLLLAEVRYQLAVSGRPDVLLAWVDLLDALRTDGRVGLNSDAIIELLKFPTCVGEVAERLVEMLEAVERPQEPFGGDIWVAVDWAAARGIDVRDPPERPERPANSSPWENWPIELSAWNAGSGPT